MRSLDLDSGGGPYFVSLPSHARVAGRWLAVLVGLLLAVALWPARFGGLVSLTMVSGHSMEPRLHTGDLLIVRHRSTYQTGDIVVYRVPANEPGAGAVVVHRLMTRQPNGVLVMRGDNNDHNDPFHPTEADVVGRSVLVVPVLGRVLPLVAGRPLAYAIAVGLIVGLQRWRETRYRERGRANGVGQATPQ